MDLLQLGTTISVFRTSHYDVNVNETSSYLDLSPLYGHNQEAQDRVRCRDGRGNLYPDVFAEDRLLLLPPAVCVLLVLFSRNHNVSTLAPPNIYFLNSIILLVHRQENLRHQRAW
jgi:hypothetical protein